MTRISWERWAALAGVAFVALYVAAFALGIEVGNSDREILDYYGNSAHRAKEVVAFFLISSAALAFVVFAAALRSLIWRAQQAPATLAALAWAGGVACSVLLLAGNAVSRATAFTSMDHEFKLVFDADRDRVPRLPRLRSLGAHRQRRARPPPLRRDPGASQSNAVSVCLFRCLPSGRGLSVGNRRSLITASRTRTASNDVEPWNYGWSQEQVSALGRSRDRK